MISQETQNIIDEILGLDKIGRAELSKAVGKLSDNDKLPDDAQKIIDTFIDLVDDDTDQETLQKVLRVFLLSFQSGLMDGFGADLSVDNKGKVTLEIDNLRVRGFTAIKELVMKRIRVDNGNLLVTRTAPAKVRQVIPI